MSNKKQMLSMRVAGSALHFLPIQTRVPLKFGSGIVTEVTCARVLLAVRDAEGRSARGWGETPLSVQWVWPGSLSYETRERAMKDFCVLLAKEWASFGAAGHALEVGHDFQEQVLPPLLKRFNEERGSEAMPYLAALVCLSAFDLALHDAFGHLAGRDVYDTYTGQYLRRDLASMLEPAEGTEVDFSGRYPADFLAASPPARLPAWHLVGGLDPVDPDELTGREPDDGYPVLLRDWIRADGLKCLKIKLRGNNADWDYRRIVCVGRAAVEEGVDWLTTDFNCTVSEPAYVNDILDRLRDEHPRFYGMILYVEQPFAYELEQHPLDVRSVSARKPLFMDESAHDWRLVRLGRSLGWTGVALKTCKTQTGALLSLCWAKAHGMTLMVQDLSNPMLAQIPHARLAAHAGTIMGVETNSMQFYPEASLPEQAVHPGLYRRRNGMLDLSTLGGKGFGYRVNAIARKLSDPVIARGEIEPSHR